jgi:intracellular sulfur oxidation DsrE/DsrF family protein
MPNRKFNLVILLLSFATLFTPFANSASAQEGQAARDIVPIEVRKNIRVVYQVNTDEWKNGVGKPLAYLKKLSGVYDNAEIPQDERHISAVFHGKAGYWMLTDEAYNAYTKTTAGNPNKDIIRELVAMGISIELCSQTMKSHDWSADEVLPEVKLVIGAYPRIIDLQMQGYAYLKF